IGKIIEYIASGHVYQVNMSQRFEMDFRGDGFELFKKLYMNNPAPFFAYINAGDHQIVSTSPERFIKRTGSMVETRPIKGTLPRGRTDDEDRELGQRLLKSRKDDAELSMIVDLLRNDMGKVCDGGSVRVEEHKRLEAYENVFHLVSIVKGDLAGAADSVDLIKATFPGGSITGCPKIRAMEIIDELEPRRRHIYTGAIGYISFHDTMDLSIAIRTATIYNGKVVFSVGGGIVYDSDPSDEFDETLHKGKTIMDVFKGKEEQSEKRDLVWIDGVLKQSDLAGIPLSFPGFQYGFGFFETIRAIDGRPQHLKEHLERFNNTWKELFERPVPDLSWEEIAGQVLTHNHLDTGTAAVKIMAAKGDRDIPPFNDMLIVTARSYNHRPAEKKEPGLRLISYPEPRQTPLAEHKTLNYLYYLLAGRWAKANGADEALIMNPDNTISETNTANIMMIKDREVILPLSLHVLPGVMERVVLKTLVEWDYTAERREIKPEELFSADEVIMTNSLIGAVSVLSLDGKRLGRPSGLCDRINGSV
ncbi:MAG: bifunctional anthranilate synthase component I family protein/aminotransferase class IV, partial [Deltaproteobacteria bacterium]|nr:bifunctional anthranilate synthase component I family protein/aminotransferase class IV [Deltaproteobacteria bacterium]